MKYLFTIGLLLIGLLSGAQTSVIFHRSHAGTMNLFKPAEIADNLGWTGTERHPFVDTSLQLITAGDTVSKTPYCNNPNITKDSLDKKYPLYTTVPDSTTKKTAAEDTLAKPKEKIKSRHEVQKNEFNPSVDFYGNPKNPDNPGALFITGLIALMLLIGSAIWFFNRKKVSTI
jgi:hypothetical protein